MPASRSFFSSTGPTPESSERSSSPPVVVAAFAASSFFAAGFSAFLSFAGAFFSPVLAAGFASAFFAAAFFVGFTEGLAPPVRISSTFSTV